MERRAPLSVTPLRKELAGVLIGPLIPSCTMFSKSENYRQVMWAFVPVYLPLLLIVSLPA
ncbi:MAG TPA: hypothetical protein VFA10_31730 [Ktedonobacteraceae bacterium]|nr:hypothetical protein [Ktedonobacteraceae bacterium]